MNFAVLTASGKVIARPDTTWRHGDEALYAPEFVSRIGASPALFIHICRPGRSIGEAFAERYYDTFGCGALLYPMDFIDGSPEGFACANCLDHTTFASGWDTPKEELGGSYALSYGCAEKAGPGHEIISVLPSREEVCAAIARISRICLLRSGDVVVMELSPACGICSREEEGPGNNITETIVEGQLGNKPVCRFRIIF